MTGTPDDPSAELATGSPKILVALFFWRSLDLEGGAGLVASVVRALEQRGCRVTLLLPDASQRIPERIPVVAYAAASRLRTLAGYLRGLRRESRKADGVLLLDNNPAFHLAMSAFLSRSTPTAVHLSSPAVGIGILAQGARRQHLSHWLGKPRWLAGLLGRVLGFPFSTYVVSTGYQRDQLLACGCPEAKATVAPFGVDPQAFGPGPEPEAKPGRLVVGYLGHFSPIKGVPDLVTAWDALARECPGTELRLAWSGKGADADRVQAQIAASPSRERIALHGRVDVPEFLRGLDVVVLPFRSASIPHLPLVLLEAFACGIPVVTTRVGGLAEAVVDGVTGFAVAPGFPEALRDALRRLYDEPELRHAMRSRILATAGERYDTARFCERMLEGLLPSGSAQ